MRDNRKIIKFAPVNQKFIKIHTMKKITIIALCVFTTAFAASAQTAPKFGHINMQEVVFLMDEMDSARVELEKFSADMQSTYNAMVEELNTKIATYEQMSANWTPSVLSTKEQEIQDLQARLRQYEQNAQRDITALQNQLMGPISQKATEAVNKVGKAKGLIYIFDLSSGAVTYFDAAQSLDLTADVKAELGISPDKQLPQAQSQPQM